MGEPPFKLVHHVDDSVLSTLEPFVVNAPRGATKAKRATFSAGSVREHGRRTGTTTWLSRPDTGSSRPSTKNETPLYTPNRKRASTAAAGRLRSSEAAPALLPARPATAGPTLKTRGDFDGTKARPLVPLVTVHNCRTKVFPRRQRRMEAVAAMEHELIRKLDLGIEGLNDYQTKVIQHVVTSNDTRRHRHQSASSSRSLGDASWPPKIHSDPKRLQLFPSISSDANAAAGGRDALAPDGSERNSESESGKDDELSEFPIASWERESQASEDGGGEAVAGGDVSIIVPAIPAAAAGSAHGLAGDDESQKATARTGRSLKEKYGKLVAPSQLVSVQLPQQTPQITAKHSKERPGSQANSELNHILRDLHGWIQGVFITMQEEANAIEQRHRQYAASQTVPGPTASHHQQQPHAPPPSGNASSHPLPVPLTSALHSAVSGLSITGASPQMSTAASHPYAAAASRSSSGTVTPRPPASAAAAAATLLPPSVVQELDDLLHLDPLRPSLDLLDGRSRQKASGANGGQGAGAGGVGGGGGSSGGGGGGGSGAKSAVVEVEKLPSEAMVARLKFHGIVGPEHELVDVVENRRLGEVSFDADGRKPPGKGQF
ncbi:hypothetical protein DFJ73DRAFT_794540 [Zopfochytrium polystomum]|nr:hypothetical protein DFJ73DRAFT_794540 [Zopfochytrium polystomum]